MFQRFRNTVARFMWGRYGNDQLNRVLFWTYFVLWVLSVLLWGWVSLVLTVLCTATMVWVLCRMLSRNIARRQAENRRFLSWSHTVKGWFTHQTTRVKDSRRYRYRRCPGCKAMLRLPIKRGRRTVTCHRCRGQFKAFFW